MEDLYIQSGLHIIEKKDHYILKNGGDNQTFILFTYRENGDKFEHNDKRPTEKVYCGVRRRK